MTSGGIQLIKGIIVPKLKLGSERSCNFSVRLNWGSVSTESSTGGQAQERQHQKICCGCHLRGWKRSWWNSSRPCEEQTVTSHWEHLFFKAFLQSLRGRDPFCVLSHCLGKGSLLHQEGKERLQLCLTYRCYGRLVGAIASDEWLLLLSNKYINSRLFNKQWEAARLLAVYLKKAARNCTLLYLELAGLRGYSKHTSRIKQLPTLSTYTTPEPWGRDLFQRKKPDFCLDLGRKFRLIYCCRPFHLSRPAPSSRTILQK